MVIMIKEINEVEVKVKVKVNMIVGIFLNVYLNIIIKDVKVNIKMDNEIKLFLKEKINDIIININNINEIKEENKNIHLVEGYMMRIKWRINKLKITLNFLICMVVMVEEIKETKDK
eukprot:419123_1